MKGGESMIKPQPLATIEDLEFAILHLSQSAEMGELESIKRTIHEMRWMVEEIKESI